MPTTRENLDPVSPNDEPIEEDIVCPGADMAREQLVQDSPMKIDPTHISPKWWGCQGHCNVQGIASEYLHGRTDQRSSSKGSIFDSIVLGLFLLHGGRSTSSFEFEAYWVRLRAWVDVGFQQVVVAVLRHYLWILAMKKVLREGGINAGPITRPIPPKFVALLHREDPEVMSEYSDNILVENRHQPTL
ncbi:uncharacterized protein N7515_003520 [Penicillium bovifimosum]|uniref:Uncharacterized protein n=1 Tax=Penicillium bovifimosum TaxID=126998 RepID=A0A9W9L6B8_9EURO|nr:uncharacterized protein N7515_003520 [Penicillium bovifimosum]KAJ5138672.1 hypothetical protein N7515_003520 [Penicillium bovifimosum]